MRLRNLTLLVTIICIACVSGCGQASADNAIRINAQDTSSITVSVGNGEEEAKDVVLVNQGKTLGTTVEPKSSVVLDSINGVEPKAESTVEDDIITMTIDWD